MMGNKVIFLSIGYLHIAFFTTIYSYTANIGALGISVLFAIMLGVVQYKFFIQGWNRILEVDFLNSQTRIKKYFAVRR